MSNIKNRNQNTEILYKLCNGYIFFFMKTGLIFVGLLPFRLLLQLSVFSLKVHEHACFFFYVDVLINEYS